MATAAMPLGVMEMVASEQHPAPVALWAQIQPSMQLWK